MDVKQFNSRSLKMLYVHPLTPQQRQELINFTRQQVGRISERGRIILLSDDKYSIPQIAKIFQKSPKTVRKWTYRYRADGINGLLDKPKVGRRKRLSPLDEEFIDSTIQQSPSSFGYLYGFWSIGLLITHLIIIGFGKVSISTIRKALRKLKYVCRRPKIAPLKDDPLADIKLQAVNEAKQLAIESTKSDKKEVVFLYEDETTFRLLPIIRRMWMKINQQVRIPTPDNWNRRFSIIGALNAIDGNWHYSFFDKLNSDAFISFLEGLIVIYPHQLILLAVDAASIHTSKRVRDWLAIQPRINLIWLPKRDPQKNPVEKVWWQLKNVVAANRFYGSLKLLQDACRQFFNVFMPQDILRLTSLAA